MSNINQLKNQYDEACTAFSALTRLIEQGDTAGHHTRLALEWSLIGARARVLQLKQKLARALAR